jgi:hypothetical protein
MEIGRLRTESPRLDAALAQAAQTQARNEEAARKLEAFKVRIMGLLTATDYRWPDDLPFIRIPKSALTEVRPSRGIDNTDIEDWAVEVLGMTPEEKQRTVQALQEYTLTMAHLAGACAYETNYLPPDLVDRWSKGQWKSIMIPALGADAKSLAVSMVAQISQILGEERGKLLVGNLVAGEDYVAGWLGRCLEFTGEPQLFTICIDRENPGELHEGEYWTHDGISSGGSGVHSITNSVPRRWAFVHEVIVSQFFDPWLRQLDLTNSATGTTP